MPKFYRDPSDGRLFSAQDLSELMETWSSNLEKQVQRVDGEKLLATEPSEWVEYFVSRFTHSPPLVRQDEVTVAPPDEADIDVSNDANFGRRPDGRPTIARGTRVTFHVPFDGDAALLHRRPSQSYRNPMRATVEQGKLTFAYLLPPGADKDAVHRAFLDELGQISAVAFDVAREVDAWNDRLPHEVRTLVDARRKKLLAARDLVGAFGFPVRQRPGAAETFTVPIQRRQVLPPTPAPTTDALVPNPAMSIEAYNAILGVCRNMSIMMERSPNAIAKMGEDDIRTLFLIVLNAWFEGEATGETFNCQGKTDILIRHGGRNIFIAECKFWAGAKSLTGAIDQVLGYLAWRDTKAAIFVFSHNKDFSAVVKQLGAVVSAHPNFVREATASGETEFRAVFHQRDDTERELHLAVLAFDVPRGADAPS